MIYICSTHMKSDPSRRRFLLAGGAVAIAAAMPAAAQSEAAEALVERVIGEISNTFSSNRSRDWRVGEIERIFNNYTDLDGIARSALGPPARSASPGHLRAYRDAFRGYLARKYARQFEEFFGGTVTVTNVDPWKSHFFQVHVTAKMNGSETFKVIFIVSTRRGKPLVFDIIVSGVSVLKTEALEIRGLLDRARGDLGRLTISLQSLG